MRLDRNLNKDGKGKYALINLRKMPNPVEGTYENGHPDQLRCPFCFVWVKRLRNHFSVKHDYVEWGDKPHNEFFVIKLKDYFSKGALKGYREAIVKWLKKNSYPGGQEDKKLQPYMKDIKEMEERTGKDHPGCKIPD